MATPTTVNTWPLNGSIQEFDVTFDYLSQTFIKVNLVGPTGLTLLVLGTDYTFVTPTRIRTTLVYGPPAFTTIEIRRETSTTERLVEFQDASILHAQDLNVDALQVMHVAEEARNAATETLGVNGDGNLDARNRRIVNVLDPIDPADVVTLNYYTSQVTGVHTDRLAAEAARDKAQEWAIKPTAVEGTDQSAKTYAGQAGVSASTASTQAGIATTQAGLAATAHSGSEAARSGAEAARTGAEAARDTAGASAGTATTQAGIATTQAGIATTQAGIATTKAAEAAASAQSVDSAYLNGQLANNTVAQSVHGGQLAGNRNVIHNGAFLVWQRGDGPFPVANAAQEFFADRFSVKRSNSGAMQVSRGTDRPAGTQFFDSHAVTATGNHTLTAGTDYCAVVHGVEGYDARRLLGKTFTLTFWVKATRTGTYGVSFRSPNATLSYVVPYTVVSSNVWQKVTVTVTGGIPSDAAFNSWGSAKCLEIMWGINVGTTYRTTTTGAWVAANAVAPSITAQGLVTTWDVFQLTGIQLELGEVPTSFEHVSHGTALQECFRYYWRGGYGMSGAAHSNGTNVGVGVTFPTAMRASPTIGIYAAGGGFGSWLTHGGVAANINFVVNSAATVNGGWLWCAGSFTPGPGVFVNDTIFASAEI